MNPTMTVHEGDNFVLDERGEKMSLIKAKASGCVRMSDAMARIDKRAPIFTNRRKIKVGKVQVPMAPIIGAPFGSMFQVSADGKALERLNRQALHIHAYHLHSCIRHTGLPLMGDPPVRYIAILCPFSPIGDFITPVHDTERDNSSLSDLNSGNQKLGQEDIAALKNAGKVDLGDVSRLYLGGWVHRLFH